ncbi:MAG TPA: radical SAM protein [Nitrospirae bacterium]|nr:radical SAM protein [Nitrospirota bacterium]
MNILLINPPYPFIPDEVKTASPPLGLAYIAAMLEQNNYPVKIVDCVIEGYNTETEISNGIRTYGLSKREIIHIIEEYQPSVIGISAIFSTLDSIIRELSRDIKETFPEVKIVVGGTHATVMAEELICEPSIDYVIRGEGEYAFLGLVEYLEMKRQIDEVNNLTWKENGEIRSTPQQFIEDIDQLPRPARHLLNIEGYIKIGRMHGSPEKGVRAATLITSRGCPAKCIFCSIHSVWGRTFRGHSPEYVLNEMQELREQYKINHLLFEDDNLTFDRNRAVSIFQGMIDRKYNFSWTTPNGVAVWALNDYLLKLIKESGCCWLTLAVESGDPETLAKIIKKPLRLDKVILIVKTCRKLKIHTNAFFVIGLPGETMESIQRSMTFAEDLDVDSIIISIAAPYPGTSLYEQCKEKGYFVEDFQITNLSPRIGQIKTTEFSPKDLVDIVNRTFMRRVFKHPIGTLRRVYGKFKVAPMTTFSLVTKKFILGIVSQIKLKR